MSSHGLIDLLASMGYGEPHDPRGDTRKAEVVETGRFTTGRCSGRAYAKVVVQTGGESDSAYDYGVRLWVSD